MLQKIKQFVANSGLSSIAAGAKFLNEVPAKRYDYTLPILQYLSFMPIAAKCILLKEQTIKKTDQGLNMH